MDAVKFLEERKRMYESGAFTPCIEAEDDYNSVNAVKIVEEWSVAHPRKTRQSVFLEQWPEAMIDRGICLVYALSTLTEKSNAEEEETVIVATAAASSGCRGWNDG